MGTSESGRSKRRVWSGVSLLYLLEGNLKVWYWDVLLFYRRALFELVFAVVPVGVTQQSLFVSLTLVFAYAHLYALPYSSRVAIYTEALSYAVLLFVNVLNYPAVVFAVVTLQQTDASQSFLRYISRAQSILAFSGLLLLAIMMGAVYGLKLYHVARTSRHLNIFRKCGYKSKASVGRNEASRLKSSSLVGNDRDELVDFSGGSKLRTSARSSSPLDRSQDVQEWFEV